MEFHFIFDEYKRMVEWYKQNGELSPTSSLTLEEWLSSKENRQRFKDIVEKWSKEHPKQTYPRFIDVFDDMVRMAGFQNMVWMEVMKQEVPQNVANRYNIAPLDIEVESEWR